MPRFKRHTAVNEARVIQVVEVCSIVGEGTEDDVIRTLYEYYRFDGVRVGAP